MKLAELKKKTEKDLMAHAAKLRTNLVERRKAMVTGEATNRREVKNMRKELARTLTLLNTKESQSE